MHCILVYTDVQMYRTPTTCMFSVRGEGQTNKCDTTVNIKIKYILCNIVILQSLYSLVQLCI